MDPALDRFDIIDTTVRMAWHAPCREWDSLNDVLAPRARLDDTSLSGGDQAICTAAFQATHVLATPLGEPTWTLGGITASS